MSRWLNTRRRIGSTAYVSGSMRLRMASHSGSPATGNNAPDRKYIGMIAICITAMKDCSCVTRAAIITPANPAQSPEMILNGAYLVAAGRDDELRRAAEELRAHYGPDGVTYELTGPWPPYNFAGDEEPPP